MQNSLNSQTCVPQR